MGGKWESCSPADWLLGMWASLGPGDMSLPSLPQGPYRACPSLPTCVGSRFKGWRREEIVLAGDSQALADNQISGRSFCCRKLQPTTRTGFLGQRMIYSQMSEHALYCNPSLPITAQPSGRWFWYAHVPDRCVAPTTQVPFAAGSVLTGAIGRSSPV